MSRNEWVADASAILAALKFEPIENIDPQDLVGATVSSVNLAEVIQKLLADRLTEPQAEAAVASLDLRVVPFDRQQAIAAARLWTRTKSAGLSLADRACFALGEALGLAVVTADRVWATLDVGVQVILIR